MDVSYSEPWAPRRSNRKLFVIGAVALLTLAGAAVAMRYAFVASEADPSAPATGSGTTFSLATVSGAPGVPVTVPLRVQHAAGLGAATLLVAYDPGVVRVLGVTPGDVPGASLTWRHDALAGQLTMLLTTAVDGGIVGEATYAVLTLEAVEGAMGTSSTLVLTVGSATSASRETLAAEARSGAFRNGVTGDVSGDGVVDKDDYDLLSRHLVGEDVDLLLLNADVDGDGHVTTADALSLHQRISRGS